MKQTTVNMKDISLSDDIQEAGYSCKNITFEVGSRGHLTPENKSRLLIIQKICKVLHIFGGTLQKLVYFAPTLSFYPELSHEEVKKMTVVT